MKKITTSLVLTLFFALSSLTVFGQARVQAIHNSADPAAASVDVWVTGIPVIGETRIADNFTFRTATPFIDAPAGIPLNIVIAPDTSTSSASGIATFPVGALTSGETYVVVANGVLTPGSFASNPDGISTAFDLDIYVGANETAPVPGSCGILAHHGATDAPAVDIDVRGQVTFVNNALYKDYQGYIPAFPGKFILDVKDSTGATTVASFYADLSALSDSAITAFASGFLTPGQGNDFGLYAALANGTVAELPQIGRSRVQIIHNAADPAAATVDIYITADLTAGDDTIVLQDVDFRTATAFLDVPSNLPLTAHIAPANSMSAANAIASIPLGSLATDETYVVVANGVVNPGSFTANPDAVSIGFSLYPYTPAREASGSSNVDLMIFHGATDAPTVDVVVPGGPTLADDLSYTDFNSAGYVSVPAASYSVDVMDAAQTNIVAAYTADLSTLSGGAAVVFASGFLNSGQGEAFGVWVALPDGTTFPLPERQLPTGIARVQVIHNSPDPLLASIDIEVNGTLLPALDNFGFREATPFFDVDGGIPVELTLKDATGAVTIGTLTFDSLQSGETYTLIANGVINPGSFTANPDGQAIGFGISAFPDTRETGQNGASATDLVLFHGATDAPAVDITARSVATLGDNMVYGDAVGYIPVPVNTYTIDVTDSTGSTTVASYIADLTGLGGGAAFVFASGFLNAGQGEDFGVWVALPDGTTFPLPEEATASGTARVQVIHNAADPAAATVDVLINGDLLGPLDNFTFRGATPYVDLPTGLPIEIEVTSADGSSSIATFNYDSLEVGKTYVIVANGVANSSSFTANPDGEAIDFDLYIYDMGREAANDASKVDLLVFHGATDAPTVDVVADDALTLVDDATYGNFYGYATVDPVTYKVDITTADQSTVVASYSAPLGTATGGAAVVFASGFVDDAQGEAFGVWVALPNGTTFPLPVFVGINEAAFASALNIYPVPATDKVNVELTLENDLNVRYELMNATGQVVKTKDLGVLSTGNNNVPVDVSNLSSGIYLLNLNVNNENNFTRTIVVE